MPNTPPYQSSPTNPSVQEIQTQPARRPDMPYAPAMRVTGGPDLLFISGATPSPLYHRHPHELHEHVHPCSITEQTRLVLENLRSILDHEGLVWTDVVKVTKYLTDMRDLNAISAELRKVFADWTPASTTVCVNQLSTPGARLEIEMVVAYPGR